VSLLLWDGQPLRAQRTVPEGAWLAWGGDHTFTRYSPLAMITKDNVKDL
jgi:glucose dehydrogenase